MPYAYSVKRPSNDIALAYEHKWSKGKTFKFFLEFVFCLNMEALFFKGLDELDYGK